MHKYGFWKLAAPCLLIIAAALATVSIAGDGTADLVLGQANFTYNAANFPSARKLNAPQGVAIDVNGNLYVADVNNSRVLGWKDGTAFANGSAADLVIGQPDFNSTACNSGGVSGSSLCSPYAVAVDLSGNLYVADQGNNRVLEYNTPFAGSFPPAGGSANMVFGQTDNLTSNTTNQVSAFSLNSPWGVAVDASGNLYIADTINNRVLEYNTPPTYGTTAHMVFGQGDSFTSNYGNNGGVSANSLYLPAGVAVDASGDLYVADHLNSRVLEYNTPLTYGTTANMVFGQNGSFTSYYANNGGVSASSLNFPSGVAVDSSGDLYVADALNNRVLEYNTPLTSSTANAVFGQGGSSTSSTANYGGLSASSLNYPFGVALDASGNLYVADTSNNRVLEYDTPLAPNTTADVVLGQPDFPYNQANFPDQYSLHNPFAVTIDASATPTHLYVADETNSRVLGWNDVTTFANGSPADLVIGQPDFNSTACNTTDGASGSSLCYPYGITVDSSGNLYVADNSNSRVLEYTAPFAGCGGSFPCVEGSANLVFGQGGSTSTGCNSDTGSTPTAIDLCYPYGVAVDANNGHLYVADGGNNRVLEYNTPLTSSTANLVFGQGVSFTSNYENNGGVSANSLYLPVGVAVDSSSNLYVADYSNSRVLEYNAPLTNGASANAVFGQGNIFTSTGCNSDTDDGTPTAIDLCDPYGVAVDSSGHLYVADTSNNRVLEYNTPLTSSTANHVFGQDDSFTSSHPNLGATSASATSLYSPSGVALDSSGNLYVADTSNNRVLEYKNPLATSSATPTPTPAPTPTTSMSVTASLTFGNVPVGQTVTKDLTVKNTGRTSSLIISGATSSDPAEFAVSGGTCGTIPVTVAPNTSCKMAVSFNPIEAVPYSATLTVSDNAASSPQSVALTGTGGITMTVTPASFSINAKDGTTVVKTVTVSNKQSSSVSLSESFSGLNHGDFTVTGGGTCGLTLAAKTACTLHVTIAPTAVGTESATMAVTDVPDPLSPYLVDFTVQASVPESVSTTSLNYGNVAQTASKTKSVTVVNHATAPITLRASIGVGPNSGDFAVASGVTNGCPLVGSLAASHVCTYAVTFTPSTESAESGTLSIAVAQDPGGGPPAVSLNGTGTIPESVSPTTLSFGNVAQTGSKTMNVTLTNKAHAGGGALTLASPSFGGAYGSDFSVTGGTCGGTLSAASCTYAVMFTPSTDGAESGTLSIGVSGDTLLSVSLSGTGVTPLKVLPASLAFGTLHETATSTAKTVTVTNSSSATLTISKSVSGTSDFKVTGGTCTTLPSGSLAGGGASCTYTMTFTPSMVGPESATLGVSAVGDGASPHDVSLSGTGF